MIIFAWILVSLTGLNWTKICCCCCCFLCNYCSKTMFVTAIKWPSFMDIICKNGLHRTRVWIKIILGKEFSFVGPQGEVTTRPRVACCRSTWCIAQTGEPLRQTESSLFFLESYQVSALPKFVKIVWKLQIKTVEFMNMGWKTNEGRNRNDSPLWMVISQKIYQTCILSKTIFTMWTNVTDKEPWKTQFHFVSNTAYFQITAVTLVTKVQSLSPLLKLHESIMVNRWCSSFLYTESRAKMPPN